MQLQRKQNTHRGHGHTNVFGVPRTGRRAALRRRQLPLPVAPVSRAPDTEITDTWHSASPVSPWCSLASRSRESSRTTLHQGAPRRTGPPPPGARHPPRPRTTSDYRSTGSVGRHAAAGVLACAVALKVPAMAKAITAGGYYRVFLCARYASELSNKRRFQMS